MLSLIKVEKGWHYYDGPKKRGEPVEPGKYYRLDFRPDKPTRKKLGLIAVYRPNGRFEWLAPPEPWVKRALDGFLPYPMTPSPNVNWGLVGIPKEKLREWQQLFVGLCWAKLEANRDFRQVAHVSLGGGKTLAGLCLLNLADMGVVVAPRHVHETWTSEAEKWGFEIPICSTYESAHKLMELDPDVVILDECHMVKNPETIRHTRAEELCAQAQVAVGFTASLTGGRGPLDMRSLRVFEPGCVPAKETPWRFLFGLDTKLEEVAPGRQAYVTKTWDSVGVAKFTAPYVTTIDTSELLQELPELTEQVVKIKPPEDYQLVVKGAATSRNKSKLTAQLRQCTDGFVERDDGTIVRLNSNKIDWVEEWLEHLGEPVVIYASWRESIKMLTERLAAYEPSVLEGDTTSTAYQIERFKQGQTNLLIANSRFSAGMNLQQRCRIMLFMSLSSNPTDLFQAKGRIHRPGQSQGCQIIYLQCSGTIDERAYELVKDHNERTEEQVEKLLAESY